MSDYRRDQSDRFDMVANSMQSSATSQNMEWSSNGSIVNISYLVTANLERVADIERLLKCVEVLLQYAHNLSFSFNPSQDLSISLSNKTFRNHVFPINGHIEVLESMGYRLDTYKGLFQVVKASNQKRIQAIIRDLEYLGNGLREVRHLSRAMSEKKEKESEVFEPIQKLDIEFNKMDNNKNGVQKSSDRFLKWGKSKSVDCLNERKDSQNELFKSFSTFSFGKHTFPNAKLTNDNSYEQEMILQSGVENQLSAQASPILSVHMQDRDDSAAENETTPTSPSVPVLFSHLDSNAWNCQHCTFINEHSPKCCQNHTTTSSPSSSVPASHIQATDSQPFNLIFSLFLPSQHICQSCYKTSKVLCIRNNSDPRVRTPKPRAVSCGNDKVDSRKTSQTFFMKNFDGGMTELNSMKSNSGTNQSKGETEKNDDGKFMLKECGKGYVGMDLKTEPEFNDVKRLNALRFYTLLEVISKRIGQASDKEIIYLQNKLSLPMSPETIVEEWLDGVRRFVEVFGMREESLDRGLVSLIKESLIECHGNHTLALQHLGRTWRNKLDVLKSECFIPGLSDYHYNETLSTCLGNIYEAKIALVKQKMSHVVWGNGGVVRRYRNVAGLAGDDLYGNEDGLDADMVRVLRKDGADDGGNEMGGTDNDDDTHEDDDGEEGDSFKRRVRMLLAEWDMFGIDEEEDAKKVVKLIDLQLEHVSSQQEDNTGEAVKRVRSRLRLVRQVDILACVEAARQYDDLSAAVEQLLLSCSFCCYVYPRNQFVEFIGCGCTSCRACLADYFSQNIASNKVKHLHCFQCKQPDIQSLLNCSEYFLQLDVMLKFLVEEEVVQKFRNILLEWSVMNGKNEKPINCLWCDLMFIGPLDTEYDVTCPHCQRRFCLSCNWRGVRHHTCPNKETNQQSLRQSMPNLIDCPKCPAKFEIVKGGCLHLTCPSCEWEFCHGCGNKYSHFDKSGLYCFHERDCIGELRDYDVALLELLLKRNGIKPPTPASSSSTPLASLLPPLSPSSSSSSPSSKCRVLVQREDNAMEESCPEACLDNLSELCQKHYVEWLVALINHHHIDPLNIMGRKELLLFLERYSCKEDADENNNTQSYSSPGFNHISHHNFPHPPPITPTSLAATNELDAGTGSNNNSYNIDSYNNYTISYNNDNNNNNNNINNNNIYNNNNNNNNNKNNDINNSTSNNNTNNNNNNNNDNNNNNHLITNNTSNFVSNTKQFFKNIYTNIYVGSSTSSFGATSNQSRISISKKGQPIRWSEFDDVERLRKIISIHFPLSRKYA